MCLRINTNLRTIPLQEVVRRSQLPRCSGTVSDTIFEYNGKVAMGVQGIFFISYCFIYFRPYFSLEGNVKNKKSGDKEILPNHRTFCILYFKIN